MTAFGRPPGQPPAAQMGQPTFSATLTALGQPPSQPPAAQMGQASISTNLTAFGQPLVQPSDHQGLPSILVTHVRFGKTPWGHI